MSNSLHTDSVRTLGCHVAEGSSKHAFSKVCSLLTMAIDDFYHASLSAIGTRILCDLSPVLNLLMGNDMIIATNLASLVPHL